MRRLVAITCLCLVAAVLWVDPARAGRRWRFTPTVDVRATYNDDVQYLGKGDMETSVGVGATLEIDTARTEHTINAGLTQYKYGDMTEYDRMTQSYSLESIHRATERLTLIGNYGYDVDYTLGTSEEETGEVGTKVRRERQSLSGRAQYLLNERTLVGLTYGYDVTQYAKDYVDTQGHSLTADIAWMATERLTLLAAANVGRVESEFQDGGTGDYLYWGGYGGFRYDLTEIYTLFANVGNQWSRNDLQTGSIDETINKSGRTFNGGIEWDFERSNGRLTYARDTTTSLTGSTLDRDRILLTHTYQTTERSALSGRAAMTLSESDGVLSQSDNRSWSAGVDWRYRMTENHNFWIGYTHNGTENRITDVDNDRNSYWLRFQFNFPEEWTLGGARY